MRNKNITSIITPEAELRQNIDNWQAVRTDKKLHVKYDPSQKTSVTHFDAIMADVNESEGVVKDFLETQVKSQTLLQENFEMLSGLAGLSFATEKDAKKEAEFRKKIKQERERELQEEIETTIKK